MNISDSRPAFRVFTSSWFTELPPDVADRLGVLATGAPCVALLCFEQPDTHGMWCHRSLIAVWLSDALGSVVNEWGYEDLTNHWALISSSASKKSTGYDRRRHGLARESLLTRHPACARFARRIKPRPGMSVEVGEEVLVEERNGRCSSRGICL